MSRIPSHERANLWVVCTAQFLCLAGMTAVLPLLPLYLQQIGITERDDVRYWTGALSAAPFMVAVFATPLWGALADRVGYKPMVVRSVLGIALASVGMGFSSSPLALLGWRGVQGAVSGIFPAAVALLSTLTPPSRIGNALAVLQAARAAGTLAGPLAGGILADIFGIRPLFLGVGTIALLTALLCTVVLKERRAVPSLPSESAAPRWRDLLGQRAVLGMLAIILVYQSTVMASWPTLALFVERLGVEGDAVATWTGLVVFAQGLPLMLVTTTWAQLVPRLGLRLLLCASILLSGLANLAVGLTSTIEAALALRALSGIAMAGFIPLSFQWLNDRASASARGRMAGISSTVMMLGNMVGSLGGSWLSVQLGLGATFWVPGVCLALTGVVFYFATISRR